MLLQHGTGIPAFDAVSWCLRFAMRRSKREPCESACAWRSPGVQYGLQISPLVIEGLWKIMDGDGALNAPANTMDFSAGPNAEADGLFGTITPEQE